MKYLKIIFVLFIFISCDVSSISEKDANNPSKLKVNISIQDSPNDNLLNQIKVKLTDGKKQIINNRIKILVNGEPLELFVKQELYYTKKSYYRTTNLLRSNSYYFEIILPDSTLYPLAFLKPLKKNDSAKFYIPEKIPINENLRLEWKNINLETVLEVWKLVHEKKNINSHYGGRYAESTIIDTINSKNGNYEISKSFYEDSLSVADYLMIRLDHQEEGLINPNFIKNSGITYNYTIEETIKIEN